MPDIMQRLRGDGHRAVIYGPTVKGNIETSTGEYPDRSRDGCNVILVNRTVEEL